MPRSPYLLQLREAFARRFGRPGTVVARAPGRVNLIGEHTDYNDGFVLPMALEQSTWVVAAPREDGRVRAVTRDLASEQTWPLEHWNAQAFPGWTSYIAGVAALLHRRGVRLSGCDLLIQSEVPVGGGLSSSAALEVSTAKALLRLAGTTLSSTDLADLCRAAEHAFAGVPCGIMDQYVSVLAQPDCALLLDCRSRTWEHIPVPLGEHVVLVVNSGVRHSLAAGAYAVRQKQCQEAVAYFRQVQPAVRALRDVDVETVQAHAAQMEPAAAARACHVTSENERTLAAAAALRKGDLAEFGRLMYAAHVSLRDNYEVSCKEIDRLVEVVRTVPGAIGTRMTGGGFGGCIVVLARRDCLPQLEAAVREKYDSAGYGPARMLLSLPGPGATIEFP